MDWIRDRWDFFFALTSGAWSAIAAWFAVGAALIVGAIAANYARKQIREAQTLRKEQAQPNVVVYMEPTKDHWGFFDLVIKNYGATPAYGVSISFTPPLERVPFASEGKEIHEYAALTHPADIPFLAPGQEWRTVWDSINRREKANDARKEKGLPDLRYEYHGAITYKGPGKSEDLLGSSAILNWEQFRSAMTVETYTLHDVAKTLEKRLKETNSLISQLHTSVSGFSDERTGLWIYPGDTEELRQERADLAARARDSHEALMRAVGQLLPNQTEVQPARGEPNPPAEPAPADPDLEQPQPGPSTGA